MAGNEQPPLTQVAAPWDVVRLAARMGGRRIPGEMLGPRIAWLASWCLVPVRRSAPFRLTLEIGAVAAVIIAFIGFGIEFDAREEDRINRAWSLVASAGEEGAGNVGLVHALETLNSRGITMAHVHLPGVYLDGVRLPNANLDFADFRSMADPESLEERSLITSMVFADLSGARLVWSNLSGAELTGANLSGAALGGADLSRAWLFSANVSRAGLPYANLSHADLTNADFSNADLRRSNLQGAVLMRGNYSGALFHEANLSDTNIFQADFSEARGLSYRQLASAQSICMATLPDGRITYRDCPNEAPDAYVDPLSTEAKTN